MRVSVFGLGYVGSVTAACLARAGHEVIGVDVNADKVAMVNAGDSPVLEPGLPELIEESVRARRLGATTSAAAGVAASDVALICVGTPSRPNGQLDVAAVLRTGRAIGAALRNRTTPYTVVLRSTVLPGTTEGCLIPAIHLVGGPQSRAVLRTAVNPEFMREGSALADFARPPFTLVGADDPGAVETLRELYASVEAPFVPTAVSTAEMVKYASNAFHALKICFANEIGDLAAALGADGQRVMEIVRMDGKLNASGAYLRPGFAFGGSCLPKDLRALLHAGRMADVASPVLASVLPSNDGQIRRAIDAVLATGRQRIGILGLAFKAGTDDLRESPMVALVEALIGKGCDVRILDTHVSTARLIGANRRFIEEQVPHLASLLCPTLDALLGHAEVLVAGNAGPEAERALAAADPGTVVVDLTRGLARPAPPLA